MSGFDKEFWLLVLDTVVSVATYVIGKYVGPPLSEDIIWVIVALQPIFVAIITSIFAQKVAAIRAGTYTARWMKE